MSPDPSGSAVPTLALVSGPEQLLAERAVPHADMTQETYEDLVREAQAYYKKVVEETENEPGPVDDAAKLLQDMVAVGGHIGLDPKQPNF